MASASYSGEKLDRNSPPRKHKFIRKRMLKKCSVCRKSLRVGEEVLECKECHAVLHTYCQDYHPDPCVPPSDTSTRVVKSENIAAYALDVPPYVPPLIMKCISMVESRGMRQKFLYRQDGDLVKAKAIARDYRANKKVPDLSEVDVHTIASILKIFLTWLSEPLITDELRDDFVNASLIYDKEKRDTELCTAVGKLPRSNRNTLAYLIRHIRNVNDRARRSIIRNLAIVFGPILVGGSHQYLTPPLFIIPEEDQIMIVENLLKIDHCDGVINPVHSQSQPLRVGAPSEFTTSRNFFDEPERPKLLFDVTTRE